jgi:hypothetical protein
MWLRIWFTWGKMRSLSLALALSGNCVPDILSWIFRSLNMKTLWSFKMLEINCSVMHIPEDQKCKEYSV